jgi:hypothetical protein
MVVLYVDDLGIAYSNESNLKKLFSNLESKGFNFTREGTFTDFLGINFTTNPANGTLTLTQKGLIQKIKEATGMSNSNYNWMPAAQAKLPGSVTAQRKVTPPLSRLSSFAICTEPAKWA